MIVKQSGGDAGHNFKEFFRLPKGKPEYSSRLSLGILRCSKKFGAKFVDISVRGIFPVVL